MEGKAPSSPGKRGAAALFAVLLLPSSILWLVASVMGAGLQMDSGTVRGVLAGTGIFVGAVIATGAAVVSCAVLVKGQPTRSLRWSGLALASLALSLASVFLV